MLNHNRSWFTLYETDPKATNLSMAGGGVKLLSILLLIAAIPCTLALILAAARIGAVSTAGTVLIYLMDEMDELLVGTFFLWAAVVVCRYAACVLQSKAQMRAASQPAPAQPESPAPAAEE